VIRKLNWLVIVGLAFTSFTDFFLVTIGAIGRKIGI